MKRRAFLGGVVAAAGLMAWADPIVQRAHAADPNGVGGLHDIEHFVFLMQENRSFDHYFGGLSGVRGFDEPSAAWRQYGWTPGVGPSRDGYVVPFRLDTARGPSLDGACINDPDHTWEGMHKAWNGGGNDGWMPMSVASAGPANAPAAMGYHTREDVPVHWGLADAFTICDNYHCSVLGPTDPNRLYWISATIDPDGRNGGPLVETPIFLPKNSYTWRTMPENLSEAGVSWKVYNHRDLGPLSTVILDGMIGCFRQAADPASELHRFGMQPTYPQDMRADVANDALPSVSWVIPSALTSEHPALPAAVGPVGIIEVLDILTANPAVWEKTALIVTYDENGGFFDHVTPPTAPPGTAGEYLSVDLDRVSSARGIRGPIGLGYRVPTLVISPYSRGGLVASETFDHTSFLRLLETRFGVDVPNLTPWRRSVTGDLTSAFDFGVRRDVTRPALGDHLAAVGPALLQCGPNIALGTIGGVLGSPYPVPPNAMPKQEPGVRRRPGDPA